MALLKCPECGKDVSSAATTCPHCGYPLKSDSLPTTSANSSIIQSSTIPADTGKSSSSDSKWKKRFILIVLFALLIATVVIIITVLIPIHNNNKLESLYNQAEALVSEKKYSDAAELYNQLGTYKDAADKAKSAKYLQAESYFNNEEYTRAAKLYLELSTYKDSSAKYELARKCQTPEGRFLYDLSRALSARWAVKMSNENVSLCPSEEVYELVDAELNVLNKYIDTKNFYLKFDDSNFGNHVKDYLNALSNSRKSVADLKIGSTESWDKYYNTRLECLAYFFDNGLTMSKQKDKEKLSDMYAEYQNIKIYNEISKNIDIDAVEYHYNSDTLTIELTNNSTYTIPYIYAQANLYMKNPDTDYEKLVDTCTSAPLDNVKPGSKMLFTIYPSVGKDEWNYYEWSAEGAEESFY